MNKLLILVTAFYSSVTLNAQDAKAIFNDEKIIFYGIDFSKAKISIPDAKPNEIKGTYFSSWNQTVLTDNARFNKESAFQKLKIAYEMSVVERRNAAVNVNDIDGNTDVVLSKETIEQMINDYKEGARKEGVGFVFIVESFSKKKATGVFHAIFFDIAKRKVLFTKRFSEGAGGPGLNNYWTRPFQVMFEKLTAGLFDTWRKEVMGK